MAGQLDSGKQGASRSASKGAIDWIETLLRGQPKARQDLAFKTRRSAAQELWVVVVDASGSTRRHHALADAKGLLASLFEAAYRQRARLAVMTASGHTPQWHISGLKPTKALSDWLETLGAGGGTPLLEALQEMTVWLDVRRKQWPTEHQRLLLLTDGRLKDWQALPKAACSGLLIDIERGPIRLGRAKQLAAELGVDYWHIDTPQSR